MTKFNYEEKGYHVVLMKPAVDNRDGNDIVKSRIGLQAKALSVCDNMDICDWWNGTRPKPDCIIVDEAQFLTENQVEDLKAISSQISVYCYGLRTDFRSRMFEGSKRLFELADSISELKSICHCGKKAIVNAKYKDNQIVYTGDPIDIGGNEKYVALCYECWKSGKIT